MITPFLPVRLYCADDPMHAKFYREQPASKLFIMDREKKVLDESCFDRLDAGAETKCYLCNAPVLDFSQARGLLPRIVECLRNLMQKSNDYSRDPQVREAVADLMKDIVDARLFLRAEIKAAVPMKAFLTKYGLERMIVDYYKEKFGAIPASKTPRPAHAHEEQEDARREASAG
jgi:hypothetical protein